MSEILKMIEEVDPNDTDKLGEIDARVSCYLNDTYQQEFIRMINRRGRYGDGFLFYYKYQNGEQGISSHNLSVHYTRSRDAQEALNKCGDTNRLLVSEIDGKCAATFHPYFNAPEFNVRRIATKTLAELHVRVQAIEYERGQ